MADKPKIKIRLSKQVQLFMQTLPPDELKYLLDHFEKVTNGEIPLEMTPEERAIFESKPDPTVDDDEPVN
jgi:hypothetical protein